MGHLMTIVLFPDGASMGVDVGDKNLKMLTRLSQHSCGKSVQVVSLVNKTVTHL